MEDQSKLAHRIQVAMGEKPADIVFVNGHVVSTFSEEAIAINLGVADGYIVALDHISEAHEIVDLQGKYLCPAMIDAHIHIESTMLSPEGFAEVAVPYGTGAVISDPHEIANVFGCVGIEYMQNAAQDLPLDIHYTIPSCVPATNMETAGAHLTAGDIEKIYHMDSTTPALSELMNYPGVFLRDPAVLEKVCTAHRLGINIDGHSPMLGGKHLNAYLNAGITTDHECTSVKEAQEKLRRGMYILMREGSAARNLKDLVGILNDKTAHRICIASDDRHPDEILQHGYLDRIWRMLIDSGVDPIRALRLMTLNPATIYNLKGLGGLGVGYHANFFTVDNLQNPRVREVYYRGKKVAENGKILQPLKRKSIDKVINSVNLPKNFQEALQKYPTEGKVRAIGVIEGQIVTKNCTIDATDVHSEDVAYMAVVERHGKNGQVGLGFAKSLTLKKGAIASTVAHDHHNLILAGKNTKDMEIAAYKAQEMGGGFVAVHDQQILAALPLPIAGLMSPETGVTVAEQQYKLEQACGILGISIHSPFMVLSFLALSVIPHLKLTDMGLVDVDQFTLVPLEVED